MMFFHRCHGSIDDATTNNYIIFNLVASVKCRNLHLGKLQWLRSEKTYL